MKKKSASQTGSLNSRVLFGAFVLLAGVLLGLFATPKQFSDVTPGSFASGAVQPPRKLKKSVLGSFPTIQVQQVVSGLNMPTGVTNAGDGSGRLFIVQQSGQIRILSGGSILPTPFLDLSNIVNCCGERGLLGLAFHPDYATNGFFYVYYINVDNNTVVARYQVSASDPNIADPNSAQTVLTQVQPGNDHKAGQLAFGPDGYLYIALGDGVCCGDPLGNGQNLETWLGKLLRVDVNRDDFPGDPDRNYGVPPDNPFVGTGGLDEIWAYGFRNPWRFSFDRATGDLFIGDVGEASWEEVNFQLAASNGGENYGWNVLEGMHCFRDVPPGSCNNFLNGSSTLPILEYSHTGGCAVISGYRYRGQRYPQLQGIYFYSDFCSGIISGAIPKGNGTWETQELLATGFNITTFGQDEAGELYVVQFDGNQSALYRITSPPVYQIYDIGVVQAGDTASQGFGVSPAGIAVGRSLSNNGSEAFSWTLQGGIVGLPNLSGRSYSVSNSANDNGIVVGTAATTVFGSDRLPVVWQDGVVSQLPLPLGETLGDANSVNGSGVAVGSVNAGSNQRGVIYSGGGATIITQTTANGSFFLTAFGINDSGRIVGQGIDPNNAARNVGIVYDIGQSMAFEVGALPGMNGALAFGVSNTGYVVGSSMFNQGSGLPFIWSDNGGMVAIPLAADTSEGSARAVNSAGWVVGDDSSAFSIPFLYDGTTTYRLADLIPPNSGWDLSMNTSSSALGISEDEVIVGTGVHNGETHAYAMVRVTPTPAPRPTPTPRPHPAPRPRPTQR